MSADEAASAGGGPPPPPRGLSIRLNLSAGAAAAARPSPSGGGHQPSSPRTRSSTTGQPPPPQAPASKKRRYYAPSAASANSTAPPMIINTAQASQFSLQHQVTNLHFLLERRRRWHCRGRTVLYLTRSPSSQQPQQRQQDEGGGGDGLHQFLALHLRGSCRVNDVRVEGCCPGRSPPPGLQPAAVEAWTHGDPLRRVLIRPAGTYTADDGGDADDQRHRFDADAQSSRGAVGMTTGLRAASIAGNCGELRVTTAAAERSGPETAAAGAADGSTPSPQAAKERALAVWKSDLLSTTSTTTQQQQQQQDEGGGDDGAVQKQLQQELQERSTERRDARLDLIAKRLADASCSCCRSETGREKTDNNNTKKTHAAGAWKVTVRYDIPFTAAIQQHLAGLHCCSGVGNTVETATPVLYTTAGTHGDHEGPRSWLPCLDSAAVQHRSTHQLTVTVTAGCTEGLTCVGFGEDTGVSSTLLHGGGDSSSNMEAVKEQLGTDLVDWIQQVASQSEPPSSVGTVGAHVIPPDNNHGSTALLDSIQATNVWCTSTWTPVPVRSLGFAIGPFKVLEDPEYFGPAALGGQDVGEEDAEEESFEERLEEFLESARKNGEGIRQVYFAPLFERKHIHVSTADRSLLPRHTRLYLPLLTASQEERAAELDATVTFGTTGVPHRALSLMRDVLALPTFRAASYTQIWIPGAVHGGATCGALHHCPEVQVNPFLGGAIMDSRLLPPIRSRLPFHQGGRVLQFLQARCAIRGWITAALPIGGNDDVGMGYLYSLFESFLMSLYERGHGGFGEGGALGGMFHSKRYSLSCGLNSSNLDFLPVQNIEEMDVVIGVIGAVPVEDRHNEQLWRGANNGSESHTSAMDEYNVRQLFIKDSVDALERGTDKDKGVPLPSMGWFGSHLSLSFLSSNATSSSDLGCGAVELLHPVGGLVYRALKSEVFRGVVEGRAGVANFIRLVRAAFIAAHLNDFGEKELTLPRRQKKLDKTPQPEEQTTQGEQRETLAPPKQPFVVCVNEILKKKGLTHTLFTRALQNLSGKIREAQLVGTLVDVERHAEDPRTRGPFVDPEGFPNSYVRGASLLTCRVGVQVESARDSTSQTVAKGLQMQAYAEPVIPEGGIAYGGPITVRVVENEGSFREFVKDLAFDGSRRDWGAPVLHAKPVTTARAQTAASGTIESGKDAKPPTGAKRSTLASSVTTRAFTETNLHRGGFQAIELIRLTNLTPLLWVRVDPMGLYGGRISVFLPDACLAEQLFHDGDACAQVDAMRALAERPLLIQGSVKVTTVHDVNVSELPVRVLGDCFRGSPALHSSLPHTPAVRVQAALALAQWQNNKGPQSKDALGAEHWIGIDLLVQYFRERFYSNSVVMPVKFSRIVVKKSAEEVRQAKAAAESGASAAQPSYDDTYQYLDMLEGEHEKNTTVEEAEDIEIEEDEEYRVRSAAVTAIACVRAKDGLTPSLAIEFLEAVLESEDAEMVGNVVCADEELLVEKAFKKMKARVVIDDDEEDREQSPQSLSFISSMLVADALLALCHVNAMPAIVTDPATGKTVESSGPHPLSRLMKAARSWLEWELYREKIRLKLTKETSTGVSGNCYDLIAACAIVALCNLAILKQSTTDVSSTDRGGTGTSSPRPIESKRTPADRTELDMYSSKFYVEIFDSEPHRNDLTRAACAQALACICCAADRFDDASRPAVGLLSSLEFMLDRINDERTSPSLRHTLALLMMDACTGKICSMQRVGAIAGRNDLVTSAARFMNGPLGASHGGDNGSAILNTVSSGTFPAASAVNDGARRGMRLLSRAGRQRENLSSELVVRVARFGTRLWRTLNGEPPEPPTQTSAGSNVGVCAYDGTLRSALLALWQWIWPKGCIAVLQVQEWKSHEGTPRYRDMGAHLVMKISDEEKAAANAEENALEDINRLVAMEIDRQVWRGEMAQKAYDMYKASKGSTAVQNVAAAEQGIGQPLPPIMRDAAYKQGGWIASAAQQRRALKLDGGKEVKKVRLTVKSSGEG